LALTLTICNQYTSGVSVAIGFNSQACAGKGNFMKTGWIRIEPGHSQIALSGNLAANSRYLAYYAVAEDGDKIWEGTGTTQYITGVNFTQFGPECWNEPENFQASFRFFDVGSNDDFILTLSSSSRDDPKQLSGKIGDLSTASDADAEHKVTIAAGAALVDLPPPRPDH
jgi:uncharacterized membrane protein